MKFLSEGCSPLCSPRKEYMEYALKLLSNIKYVLVPPVARKVQLGNISGPKRMFVPNDNADCKLNGKKNR